MIGKYPRSCNHFALNKFQNAELHEWKLLIKVMQEMLQGIWTVSISKKPTDFICKTPVKIPSDLANIL